MKKILLFSILTLLTLISFAQYPTSYARESNYEFISRVTLSTLDNQSGASTYSDFTDEPPVAGLVIGQQYTITVEITIIDVDNWNECVRVWIDFNRDENFTSDELVLSEFLWRVDGVVTVSATFTVPSTAVSGMTRMRVSLKWPGVQWWSFLNCPEPNEVFDWGEVEDYRVAINVPAVSTLPVINIIGTSADGGGNVLSPDNSAITERGICYATHPNPVYGVDQCIKDAQATTGSFYLTMNNLTQGVVYYVRAYAINADGVGYGQNETFSIYNIHYVSRHGDDVNGDGTINNPWATISHALDMSAPMDWIIVMDTITEANIFIKKDITIKGINDTLSCIVQAQPKFNSSNVVGRIFYIYPNVNVTIEDLVLKNGNIDTAHGGAIYIASGANVTIKNCAIDSNIAYSTTAYYSGGAIYVADGANLDLSYSEVIANESDYGSAITFAGAATGRIENVTFGGNTAIAPSTTNRGGAVWASGNGDVRLIGVTVAGNTNNNGLTGGLYGDNDPTIFQIANTLVGNNGVDLEGTVSSLDYNLIENNNGTINNQGANDIVGQDPALDVLDYYDAYTRTFKPLPSSPAINAANDAIASQTDQRGKYRLGQADIGAHEYLGTDTYIWDGTIGAQASGTGSTTGSWFDVNYWTGNFLPTEVTEVTVRNGECQVDLAKAGKALSITIEKSASLNTLTANDTIIVGKNIYNLSNKHTGAGLIYLNAGAQEQQHIYGLFGNMLIDNVYGVVIDTMADFYGNLIINRGQMIFDTNTVIFRQGLTLVNGRIIDTREAKVYVYDTLNAATFPLLFQSAGKLVIDRPTGADINGGFTVQDSLILVNGDLIVASDSLSILGGVKVVNGGIKGDDKAIVHIGGTVADAPVLPGFEVNKFIVERAAGAKIMADDTLIVDSLILLNGGNLYLAGGDLLLKGKIQGTDSLAGDINSDLILRVDTLDLGLLSGFRVLDTLIIDSVELVNLTTPLVLSNVFDVDTGTFVITTTSYLKVNGPTYLRDSAKFIIKSGPTGTGSFIDNGTIVQTGVAIVERYATGGDYHYISAPLSAVPPSVVANIEGNTNPNFYSYDETQPSTWNGGNHDDVTGWTNPPVLDANGNLEVTRGYALYYPYTVVYKFTGGTLNTGNITSIPITLTDYADILPEYEGWNLIGNPYPSKISCAAFYSANSSVIADGIYFWDEPTDNLYSSDDYATWTTSGVVAGGLGRTPTGYIDVGQGFFVQSIVNSGNVVFTNSMRVERVGNDFFKAASLPLPRLYLDLISVDSTLFNQLLIVQRDGASFGLDQYDAYKNEGNPNIAFYSMIDTNRFIVNVIPFITDTVVIPLGYKINVDTDFVIMIDRLENMDFSYDIYLHDKALNVYHNLRNGPYKFRPVLGRINDRFEITLYKHPIDTTYWNGGSGLWTDITMWSNGIPDKYTVAIVPSGSITVNSKVEAFKLILKEDADLILNDTLIVYEGVEAEQYGYNAPEIFNPKYLIAQVDYKQILPTANKTYTISPATKNLNNSDIELNIYIRNKLFKADSIIPGLGYVVKAPYSGYTINYSGDLITEPATGYIHVSTKNLLANPYATYYDINNFPDSVKDVYTVVIGTETNGEGQYAVYNKFLGLGVNGATQYLQPLQPFEVTTLKTDSIVFDYSLAVSQPVVKKAIVDHFMLNISSGNIVDQAALAINANAIDSIDVYDSEKRFTSDAIAQVYFVNANKDLAINTLPSVPYGVQIPFNIKFPFAGDYEFVLTVSNPLLVDGVSIVLEDLNSGGQQIIKPDSVYTLTAPQDGYIGNYALTFIKGLTQTIEQDMVAKIYSAGHSIYVEMPVKSSYEVEVYDVSGRKLLERLFADRVVIEVDRNITGILTVVVKDKVSGETYSGKVVVF